MASVGTASADLLFDKSQVGRSLTGAVEGNHGLLGGLGRKIGGLLFATAGAVGAATLIKSVIKESSDLNETVSKTKVVFGAAAGSVLKFGATSAKALGQSKNEALSAAATYGNLFRALGIGEGEAAKMSTRLVTLAGDLASFNNVSPTEALDALRSGLTGETEPLKRFGVNLNEATLKAKALQLGLADGKGVLSANAKAQAAYALILEQTSLAQGDFARTSGGLANQQRILGAQWTDLKANLGNAVLPIVTRLVTVFNNSLPRAIETAKSVLSPFVADVKAFVKTLTTGFTEDEGTPIERFALTIRDVLPKVGEGLKVVKDNLVPILTGLAAFIAANRIAGLITQIHGVGTAFSVAAAEGGVFEGVLAVIGGPVTLIVVGLAALAAGAVYAYTHFKGFREVVQGVVDFLRSTVLPAIQQAASWIVEQFGRAVDWFRTIWPQVTEAVGHVVNAVSAIVSVFVADVTTVWHAWGDDLLRIAKTIWNFIQETIENALQVVRGIIQTVLAVINGDWGKAWKGIKDIVGGIWDQIGNVISTAFGTIRGLFGAFGSTVGAAWSALWNGMKGVVSGIWNGILGAVRFGVNEIIGAINKLIDAYNLLPFHKDVGRIKPIGAPRSSAADMDFSGATGGPNGPQYFAEGGWVQGGWRQPQLAVVHGGEYVISNDEIAAMGDAGPASASLDGKTVILRVGEHEIVGVLTEAFEGRRMAYA